MPSLVGGIDSMRDDQMTRMTITNYQNEYKRKYQNEYLTLSALGDWEITIVIPSSINQDYASYLSYSKDKLEWVEGVAPAGTFTKTAPMTLWSIGASGIPLGWSVVDYEVFKFARPA